MSALDQDFPDEDVMDSFQALDTDGVGRISLEDLQTIFLGLGFMPTRFATLPNLRKELGHNRLEITLQETITLLRKHHRKDSKEHIQSTFSDWDKTNKGYVEAIDVVAVANEQEGHHLTEQQASRLIQYFAMGDNRMTMDNFQRILHPKK